MVFNNFHSLRCLFNKAPLESFASTDVLCRKCLTHMHLQYLNAFVILPWLPLILKIFYIYPLTYVFAKYPNCDKGYQVFDLHGQVSSFTSRELFFKILNLRMVSTLPNTSKSTSTVLSLHICAYNCFTTNFHFIHHKSSHQFKCDGPPVLGNHPLSYRPSLLS